MTGLLLTLLLAAQDFRSELRLTNVPPVTLEVTRAKTGFESLARMAGINIVFDPDFMDSAITPPVHIQNAALLGALDTLSAETHNFVTVLDSASILVAPDNAAKHKQYDPQVIKPFYVTNGVGFLVPLATLVKARLTTQYATHSSAAAAVIVRDTPARVAEAENLIGANAPLKPSSPLTVVALNALGHVLITDSSGTHATTPARARLQVSAARPFSFRMTDTSQAIFENIARTAGLNVVFDRDFHSAGGVAINVENVDALEALDLLSLQTKTFWQVLDEKTILVAPDNAAKHRDLDSLIVKTFTISGEISSVRIRELVVVLRTLLNLRFVAASLATNMLTLRATPTEMALAGKIIDSLKDPAGSVASSPEIPTGSETGMLLRRRAVRTFNTASTADLELQSKVKVPITVETKPNVRTAYEELAKIIGVQITFDKGFQDGSAAPLKLQSVGAADALDFLSLHTGNIWIITDAGTIIVSPDNQTAVQGLQRRSPRTINVKNLTQQGITDLVGVLKDLFGFQQIDPAANAVQITDTQENIALAEKVVSELDRPAGQ